MKKILALALALSMSLALVACGGGGDKPANSSAGSDKPATSTPAPAVKDGKNTVYVLGPTPDHGWTAQAGAYAEAKCKEITDAGTYTAKYMSASSGEEQVDHCNTIIANGDAALVIMMALDDSAQAGFTTGTPWIAVNPNYKEINAKAETADPDSVFHYYKKLIALRKENPIMVYGCYELLLEESEELFVYTRTLESERLLVVCSFTDRETAFTIPEEFAGADLLISNMEPAGNQGTVTLRPYEAFVLWKK